MLRRRIIWMTGEWINVKISRQTRPVVYQVCLKLMNAEEDLVVRNLHQTRWLPCWRMFARGVSVLWMPYCFDQREEIRREEKEKLFSFFPLPLPHCFV